jgi:glycosyltransferase involved in cell wall biosynthesis
VAVVVHNPAAARMVHEHAPGARVIEIPHLFAPPAWPAEWESVRLRESLGSRLSAPLFGVFGYLRESKRLFAILCAFTALRRELPGARLLVAGAFVSSDLERAIAPVLQGQGIPRLPYLTEREFWRAAMAVDACINLRAPAAGETSGIAIRLMGAGKPVLVSDGLENSRYPEGSCVRVATGLAEEDSLLHHMTLLASMRACGREIGRRAAEHIAERHQIDRIAGQFWDTLCGSV